MSHTQNIIQLEPHCIVTGVDEIDQLYLTSAQAATYLGVSAAMLERLRYQGGGPLAHRLGTKAIRYRIPDLDAWAIPTTSTSYMTHQNTSTDAIRRHLYRAYPVPT